MTGTETAGADQALARGECDLVGVVRGQIADPDFARRAAAGRPAAIAPCLGCNQECVGRVGLNLPLACTINPAAGHEADPAPAGPARPARRIWVVGGGPAGLRAAATAAARGHRVTVFEREPATGGQVTGAARMPYRAGFGDLVRYLAAECSRREVDIRTGVTVTAGLIRDGSPDAVVLATGSRPVRPPWAGDHPRITDVRHVADGRVTPSGTVVVVDELGFHPVTSVAELLADRGCAVEMITSAMLVGQDLGLTLDYELWQRRARARHIRQRPDTIVTAARAIGPRDGVPRPDGLILTVLHHPTGVSRELACDWVVCAVPAAPEDALWHALAGAPFPVRRIGDCVAPRRAPAAIRDGERAGATL